MTHREKVARLFRSRPNTWIDAHELAGVGGRFAWRTRVSEVRRQGLDIQNRTARAKSLHGDTITVSLYRYVPRAA